MGKKRRRLTPIRQKTGLTDERKERLKKVEKLSTEGKTQAQIGVLMGVSQKTIQQDLVKIKSLWHDEDKSWANALHSRRIRQLTSDREKALVAFKKSKFYDIQRKCKKCRGRGYFKDGEECVRCEGDGTVTKKLEKAGDASFLKAASKILIEIMKVEGLYPTKTLSLTEDKSQHVHLQLESTNNPFERATDDQILEAKNVLELIKMESNKSRNEFRDEDDEDDVLEGVVLKKIEHKKKRKEK